MLGALRGAFPDVLQNICNDPIAFHGLLIAQHSNSMRWYLRALGDRIEEQEDEAFTLEITPSASSLNFQASRRLRHLDNALLSARAICNNNLSIISGLRALTTEHRCTSSFDQQAQRLQGYLHGIANLRGKIKNSTALLTHGLDLKNEQLASGVNEQLLELTAKTREDSLTVKIITVVGLIYLPADFVATVYGMNVLPFDLEKRRVAITGGLWAFVAMWLPLTAITVGVYLGLGRWNRQGMKGRSECSLV